MANEIRYNFGINLANGLLADTYNTSGINADQSVAGLIRDVQTIPTTAAGTAIILGGVSTPGLGVFVNLDSTNYIEIGIQVTGVFYPFLKVAALLSSGPSWLGTSAPYARANTNSVRLFYIIYET
jgi:hypothetical protein